MLRKIRSGEIKRAVLTREEIIAAAGQGGVAAAIDVKVAIVAAVVVSSHLNVGVEGACKGGSDGEDRSEEPVEECRAGSSAQSER